MADESKYLIADVGGTNARFAALVGARLAVMDTLRTHDFPSPLAAARAFLAGAGAGFWPTGVAFAVAGPVTGGRAHLTNAAWAFDTAELRDGLGIAAAYLLNDFEALAWSIPDLVAADLHAIGGGGVLSGAPIAVLGPGTGFGMAALVPAREITVVVTEGGHATLAAVDAREEALIGVLRARFGHISIERVLSGAGLVNTYGAIAELDAASVPERDAAAIVSAGLAGDCAVSRAALEQFCAWLGGAAGNAALTLGARGGVYIGGGMVPHFLDFLTASAFRARFEAKGRLSAYLAPISTSVIVHRYPALVGLSRFVRAAHASR